MPAPHWEDQDEFLDEDEFAVPAVITLKGGDQVSLSVIYDNPFVEADVGDAYNRDDAPGAALCREDLVYRVRRGDVMAIDFPKGRRVFDILTTPQPDGTGMASITLARR